MKKFKVAVTIKQKNNIIPIWNKVHFTLDGDPKNFKNLQKQLQLVKDDINKDMNQKGFALKDVDIFIECVKSKD